MVAYVDVKAECNRGVVNPTKRLIQIRNSEMRYTEEAVAALIKNTSPCSDTCLLPVMTDNDDKKHSKQQRPYYYFCTIPASEPRKNFWGRIFLQWWDDLISRRITQYL